MADLNSNSIPIELSTDGTTWKTVICLTEWSLEGQKETTTTDTFCGSKSSTGSAAYTVSSSAVADFAPTSGQASVDDLQTWFNDGTSLKFRAMYPAGTGADYYRHGDAEITSLTETFAVKESISFDFTLAIENLDITAP